LTWINAGAGHWRDTSQMNRNISLVAAAKYREKAEELRREARKLGADERKRLEQLAERWEARAANAETE